MKLTTIQISAVIILLFVMSGCAKQESVTPTDTEKPERTPEYSVRITTIKEKGGRLDWSHALNVIAFDMRGENGFYDVYIMNPDGTNEYCLTCDTELPDHHIGNPAWHPSGEWIVFQVVDTALIPVDMDAEEVNAYTNPGAGWLNNVWVTDRKRHFYQLTNVDTEGGVLHPHFSHDGLKLLWAERVGNGTPGRGGEWILKIADFTTRDQPALENIQSFRLGEQQRFCETHGFSPDDTRVLFSGNLQRNQPFWGMDVYELNLTTHELIQLTDTFDDWDEHAHYSPDGRKIVWMSSTGYDMDQLRNDFWIMDRDGSNKKQLTFFNTPGHPHYVGTPIVAADSSWGPDGKKIIAYIKTESAGVGSEGSIVMIEFEEDYNPFWQLTPAGFTRCTYWFMLIQVDHTFWCSIP